MNWPVVLLLETSCDQPAHRYNNPDTSANPPAGDLAEVNVHVPDTSGTNVNQSLSSAISIVPLTDVPLNETPEVGQPQVVGTAERQSSTTSCWLTVTVRDTSALPAVAVNVTVPDRAAPVFAVAFSVTAPLPVPGVPVTVNQSVALDDAFQVVFDVTCTCCVDTNDPGDHESCDNNNVGANGCCVTLTAISRPPDATSAIDNVAVRA